MSSNNLKRKDLRANNDHPDPYRNPQLVVITQKLHLQLSTPRYDEAYLQLLARYDDADVHIFHHHLTVPDQRRRHLHCLLRTFHLRQDAAEG